MALPPIFDRLRLPVIGSPLFIVSGPELVIAQCKAGVVGSFPALNARPAEQLEDWLAELAPSEKVPRKKTMDSTNDTSLVTALMSSFGDLPLAQYAQLSHSRQHFVAGRPRPVGKAIRTQSGGRLG